MVKELSAIVKNVFLTPERTISRKIKELVLAIELESEYTKDEIFASYLNQIPYGSNAYGVEAASQTYFNKPVGELTLGEAAIIAALPRAPSYYSPWGDNVDGLMERRNYILNGMHQTEYITAEERDAAQQELPEFAPPSIGTIRAPHFTLAVTSYLINRYGEETVRTGGLKVITTLDPELQEIAERVVAEGAERNEELYSGKNAAMVAQDPKTGQVLALVGSRNYFDEEIDGNFNVATQGLRQPGSALKPFVYLVAFEKGLTPETIVFDAPTEFVSGDPNCPAIITPESELNDQCFNPDNFDGVFRGPVSLKRGLSQSINVPSVKTLYLAGFDDVIETIKKFGITTLSERWRYGLSLVLGGGEVRLVELVNAYSTLAQEGVHHEQIMVLRVETSNGDILEEYTDSANRVFNVQPTRLINQILSDKQLRSGLFQSSLGLTVFPDREVALKTGTTDDYRDAWALGYTPFLVVGVWAGNNNNEPMQQQGSSILAAVPIWSNFWREVFVTKNYSPEVFGRPDPKLLVNKPMLNGQALFTPSIDGTQYPQLHSILYWINKKNPLGPVPNSPADDSQFYNWEQSVVLWAMERIPNFEEYNKPLPQNIEFDTVRSTIGDVSVLFKSPTNGEFVTAPFFVQATATAPKGLQRIELYINHNPVQTRFVSGTSYQFFYYLTGLLETQNLIEVKAFDVIGNESSGSIIIFRK